MSASKKRKRPTIGVNDFASRFPALALELDEEMSGCTAQDFTYGARMQLWWKCPTGLHSYQATPNQRTGSKKVTGCSYCSHHQVLAGFNDLETLRPELVKEQWDWERNDVHPSEITSKSHLNVWWICKCGNSVQKPPNTKGDYCMYCTNRELLSGFNDLATVYPEYAKLWHPTKNGTLTPDQVIASDSINKYWWKCERGHERQRTVKLARWRGCGKCTNSVSKAELEIEEYLKSQGIATIASSRVLDGKEIDILLPDCNIGIEYNGLWWHSEEQGTPRTYHYDKWKLAKQKGIDLIFVNEADYLSDPGVIEEIADFVNGKGVEPHLAEVRNGTLDEVRGVRAGLTPLVSSTLHEVLFSLNAKSKVSLTGEHNPNHTIVRHWDAGGSTFDLMDVEKIRATAPTHGPEDI